MANRDVPTGDQAFDDSLEDVLRGDWPAAAVEEELEAAHILARRLAQLREAPHGARERTWKSVQIRIALQGRKPFWQWLDGTGLGSSLKLLVAAAIIILVVHAALPFALTSLGGFRSPAVTLGRGESYIAFVSQQDGNPEIYAMNADGSGLRRLTDHPAFDGDPAWSPDGRRIAFRSQRDGNNEIYVMKADGTGIVRLTDHPADDLHPVWSPDGQQIAFISNRDGDPGIYVMNADGSGIKRLTDDLAQDGQLAWASAR